MINLLFGRYIYNRVFDITNCGSLFISKQSLEEFDTGKGMRQGCILSPLLFNIYAEKIMIGLDKWEGGIGIGGRV